MRFIVAMLLLSPPVAQVKCFEPPSMCVSTLIGCFKEACEDWGGVKVCRQSAGLNCNKITCTRPPAICDTVEEQIDYQIKKGDR